MHSSLLSAAGALTVLLGAGVASADEPPDAVRASALFAEGRQLMAAGDYASACPKLAESQALDPAADTALDLGICYQKASQAAFKAAHDLARSPEAGSSAGSAPTLALAPGPEAPSPGQTQRVAGLVIGGAGVIGIVTALITGVMAKSASDDVRSACAGSGCPPSTASRLAAAHDLGLAASISLITGGVALGTGAVVFFSAPKSKTSTGSAVGLGPAEQGAGLAIVGRF